MLVFLGSLAAFWLVVPFGDFDTIIGDNVAQVGYWRILIDRAFVGSVGASSMKPGLILLFGAAHDLSLALFHSTGLIKIVFALAGAGLAAIVARIARPVGGKIAGVGAVIYMLTKTPVPTMFAEGTSMLVFLPLLLWGVWLFSRGRDGAGAIVLCLAALIRIEAFAVLLWLALAEQLFKRRWRAFFFSSAVVVITIALTIAVYYRVQGSVARFNAGGPPVGYIFAREPSGLTRLLGSLEYTVSSSVEMLFEQCGFPYLAIPALLALAFSQARRFYASLLG
ncbi:MAG TPA: glycosyltransferase 87 family protein, partial [Polyangiaceae bacterium]